MHDTTLEEKNDLSRRFNSDKKNYNVMFISNSALQEVISNFIGKRR